MEQSLNNKPAIAALKAQIKKLSAEQVNLKNQRKTVRISGERTMSAAEAASEHLFNRYELKHMFIAYAIMRNKPLENVIKPGAEYNQKKVDNIISEVTSNSLQGAA